MQPVHVIKLVHRWQEAGRTELDSGSIRTTEKCLDCGAEIEILHLTPGDGPKLHELPPDELTEFLVESNKIFAEITERIRSQFQQLVEESGYGNFEELARDINRRTNGEVNAHELPFYQLETLVKSRNDKEQKKTALAFRQGLICNRCKSIVYSLDQLTLDHIIPESKEGKKLLPNLQLFCPECNKDKDDNDPTELDVSPFYFRGEPSTHWITCVEVERRRLSYDTS